MRQVLLLDDNPAQLTIREMVLRKFEPAGGTFFGYSSLRVRTPST